MSEEERLLTSGGRFRANRFPTFGGAGTVSPAQSTGVADTTGLSSTDTASKSDGLSNIYAGIQQPEMPEVPGIGDAAKGMAGMALQGAGSTFGSHAGAALEGGASLGEAAKAGYEGVKMGASNIADKAINFFNPADTAAKATATQAATQAVSPGLAGGGAEAAFANASRSASASGAEATFGAVSRQATITAPTRTIAGTTAGAESAAATQAAGGEAGSIFGNAPPGVGAAIGAGLGTAVIGLAMGAEPKQAIAQGVGTAVGYGIGMKIGFIGGPVGGIIGGMIGGLVGGSVICSELVRQNKMPLDLYRDDITYGRMLPKEVINGYHKWAIPIVKQMRKRPWVTSIFQRTANWRAKEVSHRLAMKYRGGWWDRLAWINGGHIRGKMIRIVFEPMCYAVGLFVADQDYKQLYLEPAQ